MLGGAGEFFRTPADVARLVSAAEAAPQETVERGRRLRERARDYDWDDVADRYERLCLELEVTPRSARPSGRRADGPGQEERS